MDRDLLELLRATKKASQPPADGIERELQKMSPARRKQADIASNSNHWMQDCTASKCEGE